MRTERLYYDYVSGDPFSAGIIEVRPWESGGGTAAALVLDRTIFYPEGGGQSADRGSVNGMPLLDVREQDGEILHIVSIKGGEQPVSGPARLILDAVRRRDFTVQHTGQHLLSGTILRMTGKPTVSMHLGEEVNTIDVDSPEISAGVLTAVEEAAADAIERDHPVIIHLCPPEDAQSFPLRKVPPQGEDVIRVVEITENDFSPCCGTHCTSTAQIGALRVLGAEKYKGMTRVSFITGRRVLRDSRLLRENAGTVSRSLKVPLAETGRGVLALLEKTKSLERRVNELEDAAAQIKAAALLEKAGLAGTGADEQGTAPGPAVVAERYADTDMEEVLRIGRAAQKLTGAVLILASERDLKFAAFCSAKGRDIRALVKDALEKAGGKGGGGPSFFQGLFASSGELTDFLSAVSDGKQS
ncbi:MAG: alanyl-tRNA editing protein [Treponema sp.]|jgi:alanyl-tRNA synthetase|nr:alanyl-tRNA editing protein [Treponema sp.]